MTKHILTKEQLKAKIDEFNNMPKDKRCAGMKSIINCEYVRDFVHQAWNFTKKASEEHGITDIDNMFFRFSKATFNTIAMSLGLPEIVMEKFSIMLATNDIVNGMLWYVFSEVVPEEDVVLLTGNFDVQSEVPNG